MQLPVGATIGKQQVIAMCGRKYFQMTGVRKNKGYIWPCLLSSHRTSVLLIGVEGFPHGGFRHFIRYVNIRGVTPEEQGQGKEEEEEESQKQIRDKVWGLFGSTC